MGSLVMNVGRRTPNKVYGMAKTFCLIRDASQKKIQSNLSRRVDWVIDSAYAMHDNSHYIIEEKHILTKLKPSVPQ